MVQLLLHGFLELSGDGLRSGQETICIGSQGVDGTPASNGMTNSPMTLDVAIPCVGSNQVSVAVAMDVDVGSAQASITLVFAFLTQELYFFLIVLTLVV